MSPPYPPTPAGTARRLADDYADEIRWMPDWSAWAVLDPTAPHGWSVDFFPQTSSGPVWQRALATARRQRQDHPLAVPPPDAGYQVQQAVIAARLPLATSSLDIDDPLAAFLDQCTIPDPAARTVAKDLYAALRQWAIETRTPILTKGRFYNALRRAHNLTVRPATDNKLTVLGIALRD